MQIIKEKLDIDDVLEKRIKNTLKFLNIKLKIIKGNKTFFMRVATNW